MRLTAAVEKPEEQLAVVAAKLEAWLAAVVAKPEERLAAVAAELEARHATVSPQASVTVTSRSRGIAGFSGVQWCFWAAAPKGTKSCRT